MARDGSSTPAKRERVSGSGGSGGEGGYEGPDRISSLGDELLHHILLFLPLVEAIRTCVLSRRWVGVWTGLPRLELNDDAARAVPCFPSLVEGVLLSYDAGVSLRDLTISVHGDDIDDFGNDNIRSWVDDAARLVTGRFHLDVSRGTDILYDYDVETDLLELPCFERATEISISISDMMFQLVLDDDGPTFALLTKLHLYEVVIADEGEYLSEVVSQGCPRLEILELVGIYFGVSELTIRTSSLLTLCLVSVNDLQRLDVDAANLTTMQVKDCFGIVAKGSMISLSTPAMKEFYWEGCCPEEVKLIGEPGCLQKIACVYASSHFSSINASQSHCTKILELLSSTCTDVLRIEFPIKPESEEQNRLIKNMKLPYSTELELVVKKNEHTLAPTIVHILKKRRWIKRFSLQICPKNNHIQCEPYCTCRQPSNWRDQEISLGSLEELAINGFEGTCDEKLLIYFIIENSKVLRKVSLGLSACLNSSKLFLHNLRQLCPSGCMIELNNI